MHGFKKTNNFHDGPSFSLGGRNVTSVSSLGRLLRLGDTMMLRRSVWGRGRHIGSLVISLHCSLLRCPSFSSTVAPLDASLVWLRAPLRCMGTASHGRLPRGLSHFSRTPMSSTQGIWGLRETRTESPQIYTVFVMVPHCSRIQPREKLRCTSFSEDPHFPLAFLPILLAWVLENLYWAEEALVPKSSWICYD